MTTPLIALNGIRKSGKDTAYGFIKEWGEARGLKVVRGAFADLLKLSAARSLGAATNLNDALVLMNELKDTGEIIIVIPSLSYMKSISGREFLKWYGTEGHRDVFWEEFWLDMLLPKGVHGEWTDSFTTEDGERPDIAVITDLRFANEARRVHDLGGVVWNIDRGLPPEDHPSEQPLPDSLIDLRIPNKGSLEQFETEIKSNMTADFHMRFVERPDPLTS